MTSTPSEQPVHDPNTKEGRAALLREAYSAATTRLRDENPTRFQELRVEEAKQRGVDYTPPKTKEERAAEQLDALLNEHPNLRDRFTQVQ